MVFALQSLEVGLAFPAYLIKFNYIYIFICILLNRAGRTTIFYQRHNDYATTRKIMWLEKEL